MLVLVLVLVLVKAKGDSEKGRRVAWGMRSRYVLPSSPAGRTRRGRRWVRLLLPGGGEQGEQGEVGAEEEERAVDDDEGNHPG